MTTSNIGSNAGGNGASIPINNNDNETRARINAQIVINGQVGQQITLASDHFSLLDSALANPESLIFSVVMPLPSGVAIITPDDEGLHFTYQDIMDGLVILTITDPSAITGLQFSLDDGRNVPLLISLQIIQPPKAQSQPLATSSDQALNAEPAPQQNQQETAVTTYTIYINPNPETNNVIDLTGDDVAYRIDGGDGHDKIKPGSGNDIITGGLGDDEIDLSNGGQDVIQYFVGYSTRIYALSGSDRILGFKRGQDSLVIQIEDDENAPTDIAAFFDAVDGTDQNALEDDDKMIVSLIFNHETDDQGNLIGFVSGVRLSFQESYINAMGRISLPFVSIEFDQGIGLLDFVNLIGLENIDVTKLAIKNPALLSTLLGSDPRLELVPIAAVTAINLSVQEVTLGEDSAAVKLADITLITEGIVIIKSVSLTTDSDIFEIKNGNELWLKSGSVLDYEIANLHKITIQSDLNSDVTQDFTLAVNNVFENTHLDEGQLVANHYAEFPHEDHRIDWLLFHHSWSEHLGQGVELTFSFIDPATTETDFVRTEKENYNSIIHPFSDALKQKIRDALKKFSDVTLLTFKEIPYELDANGQSMSIIDIGVNKSFEKTVSSAWFPWNSDFAGNIWFRSPYNSFNDSQNLVDGSYYAQTLIHEIGHALGLSHSQDQYAIADIRLQGHQDNTTSYTTMAYAEAWGDPIDTGASNFTHKPTSLMINDILALQYLYGVNQTHNRGDTIYDLSSYNVLHETIWDAGGIDSLSWADQATSARFNLNPGTFSSFGAITGPDSPILLNGNFPDGSGLLGIADHSFIENAIGGNADDLFYASVVANNLDGGDGNDTASYLYSDQGVIVSLLTGNGTGGYAAGDRLH